MTRPVTHVFGQGAREYRDAHHPSAVVWEAPTLNPKVGASGSEQDPRTILVMPGQYDLANGYLGVRADVSVVGLEGAVFKNTDLVADYAAQFEVANLTLKNSAVSLSHWHESGRQDMTVRDNRFCEWTRIKNGVETPNGRMDVPATLRVIGNEFDGVGGTDNSRHAIYAEGRPHGRGEFIGNWFRGARKCSQIKTTYYHNRVQHNRFDTFDSTGLNLAHTMIDIPACSETYVVDNRFSLWAQDLPHRGLFTAPIFWRDRKPGMLGADKPPYGSAEYNSVSFWDGVALARGLTDDARYFNKYVVRNVFELAPGSKPLPWLRSDGTYPLQAIAQLQTGARALAVPANWTERCTTYHTLNTFGTGVLMVPRLMDSELVKEIAPGALWPRTLGTHYPRVVYVAPVVVTTLPQWLLDRLDDAT